MLDRLAVGVGVAVFVCLDDAMDDGLTASHRQMQVALQRSHVRLPILFTCAKFLFCNFELSLLLAPCTVRSASLALCSFSDIHAA